MHRMSWPQWHITHMSIICFTFRDVFLLSVCRWQEWKEKTRGNCRRRTWFDGYIYIWNVEICKWICRHIQMSILCCSFDRNSMRVCMQNNLFGFIPGNRNGFHKHKIENIKIWAGLFEICTDFFLSNLYSNYLWYSHIQHIFPMISIGIKT